MLAIFIGLVLLALSLVYFIFNYKLSYWRRRGIAHDAPSFPHGNLHEFRRTKNLHEITQETYNKFKGTGPYAGFYAMFEAVCVPIDLDFIKNVLIKDFNYFPDRGMFCNDLDDPLTGNLFHVDGPKWRMLRQRLTPVFTSGKMKFMFGTVRNIADEFVAVLTEKTQQSDDGILEITDLVCRFTSDVIGNCAFGLECNSLRDPQAAFVTVGQRIITTRNHAGLIGVFMDSCPGLARRMHLRQFTQDCEDFYMSIVRDTVKYREENNVKRNDFMDILIDMKNGTKGDTITFNELVAQSFIFFIAGFDTSSTTMSMALYQLARNPDIQVQAREEIAEVLQRHNNVLTYESLQEMKLLNRIICETLRIYPPLPVLNRKCRTTYQTSDPKYNIEEGTSVLIPVYAIHHDPDIYPDPERFDPDRFTEEQIQKRHPCAWLPFSDGPRNCIGLRFGQMQTATGLANLLRNFHFSTCEQTQNNIKFHKLSKLLSVLGGIHLKVERI